MSDFTFLQNPVSGKWVVSAPHRAKRPDVSKGAEPRCPFCPGREQEEPDIYRVGGEGLDSNWQLRVINNKYPFAPIHEVIIHSPDHHKNFDELPLSQVEIIFQTYRQRYNTHKDKGEVYIFHNRGEKGGESLPHPHTQVAVVPFEVKMDIPRLDPWASIGDSPKPNVLKNTENDGTEVQPSQVVENDKFYMFCPLTSQWPDEVWIAPKERGKIFGEITDEEITDLSQMVQDLVQIFDIRHGHEFPFNFYIYPGGDWYMRLIPRLKTLGGFEVGTGVFINTQDPKETIAFIKAHYKQPNREKITTDFTAKYRRGV